MRKFNLLPRHITQSWTQAPVRAFALMSAACALALGLLIFGGASPTEAQSNLLRDPGFEGEYTGRGRPDFNIPLDWGVWFTEQPRNETWQNLQPVAFPHRGPDPSPHGGTLAMNLNKGFATFTAAIYQQVVVPANSNVTGSAWGWLHTCNIGRDSDRCGSAVESGAFMRVGIDPRGGTNPLDPGITWSTNALPHDRWDQMTVSATAQGGTVTLFLYVTQQWPAQLNNAYWDDASLIATGGTPIPPGAVVGTPGTPGAPPPTAVPTSPPFVNFVQPQPTQTDGSVVHTVQSGDTINSIAFAYGVTRDEIVTLNNIRDARLIQPGQVLIIRPAGEVSAESTLDPEATLDAESTLEAEVSGETGSPVAPPLSQADSLAATRSAFQTAIPLTLTALPTRQATARPNAATGSGSLTGGQSGSGGALPSPTPTFLGVLPDSVSVAAVPTGVAP